MPCLIFLLALVAPRLVSVVLWVFTSHFHRAFDGRWWLLGVGILLMPFTTLAYAWATNAYGGVHGAGAIVVMILAVMADLSALEGSRRSRPRA